MDDGIQQGAAVPRIAAASAVFVMKERLQGRMHARSALAIQSAVKDLDAAVTITLLDHSHLGRPCVANAKSILELMIELTEAVDGCRLRADATGREAVVAMERLSALNEVWVPWTGEQLENSSLPAPRPDDW